jgi:DNA-nicking Smr family endonuclease
VSRAPADAAKLGATLHSHVVNQATRDLAELKALWRNHQREGQRQARLAAEQARLEAVQRAMAVAKVEVTLQEHELFVRSVGPVVPLRHPERADTRPAAPLPEPRQLELDNAQVLIEALSDEFDPISLLDTDDQLAYRRDGIGVDVMHKLRRGTWVVQGQVDLHGLTRDAAREALGGFLLHASKRGWRCVRVVHGKGLGSPGRQPVLKGKVRTWLAQRQEVLAFTQARGPDGGAGALIVLLDSSRRTSISAALGPA